MKRLLLILLTLGLSSLEAYTWRVWNDTSSTIRVTCSSSDIFTKFDAKTVKPGQSVKFETKRGQCLESIRAEVKDGLVYGKRAEWKPSTKNLPCASYDFHVMIPNHGVLKAYQAELSGGSELNESSVSSSFQQVCNVQGYPWWWKYRKVKIEAERR